MSIQTGQEIVASDYVDESSGASDSGKATKLDAGGKLSSTFFPFEFGAGSDGDVTISSPTTLTRDMYYNNLTVNSTLTTDGYRIFVKGTLSGSGTIDWGTANAGGNATVGGPVGSLGAQSGSGPLKNTAGAATSSESSSQGGQAGNGGNFGSNGVTGGAGGAGGAGGGAGVASRIWERIIKIAGFLAYTGFNIKSDFTFETFKASTGGSGGNGGGGSSGTAGLGGGSGASGGTIVIAANIFAGTFTIKATGGNGGNGCSPTSNRGGGGGGAGGNGGCVIIIYGKKTWTGSYNLAGGNGGSGASGAAGAGSNGNNGSTGTYYEIPATGLI